MAKPHRTLRNTILPSALSPPAPLSATRRGFLREVDFVNASVLGAAGALVSAGQHLTAYFSAQLAGELLPPGALAQMRATVPRDLARGVEYRLGLARYPISGNAGGGWYWGHGGTVEGTRTRGGVTEDGRAVLVAVNEISPNPEGSQAVVDNVDRIFQAVPRRDHRTKAHQSIVHQTGTHQTEKHQSETRTKGGSPS
ncbi:hypothetical protein [Streptomyces melanosporofaciens]|uniref:Beta-lactamase n=1 Tax=Streptomyces melanosporofaciens TaxID=67327 RepID=A0A1H4ZK27_STRMJ|nr:hypothetical protein [Streptomyces melanosporofaciens]SED29811.1 hypothetical protein SAMN04490356_7860 [Streptomyces melanosporofaciens]